jgi:hypothetical protein
MGCSDRVMRVYEVKTYARIAAQARDGSRHRLRLLNSAAIVPVKAKPNLIDATGCTHSAGRSKSLVEGAVHVEPLDNLATIWCHRTVPSRLRMGMASVYPVLAARISKTAGNRFSKPLIGPGGLG